MGAKRPPEIEAKDARKSGQYWMPNGMEVRPISFDDKKKTVLCSRLLETGHRKRDYTISYSQKLLTQKPEKPVVPAAVKEMMEATAADEPAQVPVKAAPAPRGADVAGAEFVEFDPKVNEAAMRVTAFAALRQAMDCAAKEDTKTMWRHYFVAVQLNPAAKSLKSLLLQQEVDVLAVQNRGHEIIEILKKVK